MSCEYCNGELPEEGALIVIKDTETHHIFACEAYDCYTGNVETMNWYPTQWKYYNINKTPSENFQDRDWMSVRKEKGEQ